MTSSLIQKPTSKLVMALRLVVLWKMIVYFVAIISYINLSKEKTGSMVCVACKYAIIGSGVIGHSRTFEQGSF